MIKIIQRELGLSNARDPMLSDVFCITTVEYSAKDCV